MHKSHASLPPLYSLRLHRREVLIGMVGMAIAACQPTPPPSDSPPLILQDLKAMKLASSAFSENHSIPATYTCDGANLSPPLRWDAPPAGTQSLVLICDDPDAPHGTWVHWVLYDLPPTLRQLPPGIPPQSTLPDGGIQGTNDFRQSGYGGPCPPKGTHRYFFKLYALDTHLNLPPGATKAKVETAMRDHILAGAELVGRYQRSH